MSAATRLESLKRFLAHVHQQLSLDFGFALWDGSRIPANYPSDKLAVSFSDEGVIASLIRRPNLDTLLNHWLSARIDIINGTMFDLVERRPKVRTREIPYKVDWKSALATGLKFLFVPGGGRLSFHDSPADKAGLADPEVNKRNIHFHYDISNKFYSLFLDPEMGYSCGYFHTWDEDLATAQINKFDMSCRRLRMNPGERFLDIGCGWGGLICHAAKNYGVFAHGITLSEQQFAYVQEKVARLGLRDRVSVELTDYSRVQGEFDKISQIEMIEHVGLANHPAFLRKIHQLLNSNGLFLHQASTRLAKRGTKTHAKKRPELLAYTKYFFPGVEFDHIGNTVANFERHGFEVHDVENWREHLARSCLLWHNNLYANREAAEREVGLVATRMWLTWLGGSSITMERATAGLFQTLVSKRHRGPSGLPPTRADLYR